MTKTAKLVYLRDHKASQTAQKPLAYDPQASMADRLDWFLRQDINDDNRLFAQSLRSNLNRYRHLTERQEAAAENMLRRFTTPKAAQQPTVAINVEAVRKFVQLFETATSNGLKRPKITWREWTVKLAPASGKNSGYLYGFAAGEYVAKIAPSGDLTPKMGLEAQASELALGLAEFGSNPAKTAAMHGHLTGACCFCSKELTDGRSVSVGYGPICADKYGLPWGEQTMRTNVTVPIEPQAEPDPEPQPVAKRGRGRPRKVAPVAAPEAQAEPKPASPMKDHAEGYNCVIRVDGVVKYRCNVKDTWGAQAEGSEVSDKEPGDVVVSFNHPRYGWMNVARFVRGMPV